MSQEDTPAALPIPGNGGGKGGGNGAYVLVIIDTPQLYAGIPCTITGSAESSSRVTGVTVTFDGRAQQVTDTGTGGDWSSWSVRVTPGAGTHQISATASGAGKTNSKSVQVPAYPVLACVSPPPGPRGITTSTLALTLGIQVNDTAFSQPSWTYQVDGGPPASPAAKAPAPGQPAWQLTIELPATPLAGPAGTSHTVQIQATASGVQAPPLPVTVTAIDTTKPQLQSVTLGTVPPQPLLTAPGTVLAGTTPVITVQGSDEIPGQVFSGIPASNVSIEYDNQALPVTQAAAGGWAATLPPVTHARHQVTVTATDAAGNPATFTQAIWVELASWTRLEPLPRDYTLMEGTKARIADPAWMLARQAAFGELTGQDTASPVAVRLRARASRLTRLRPARAPGSAQPATGPGEQLAAVGGPLEMLTEAEPEPDLAGAPRPLFAAQAGLHYLRLLRRAPGIGNWASYEQGLRNRYPITTAPPPGSGPASPAPASPGIPPVPEPGDPALQPYLTGKVPDGTRLYADLAAALRGGGALPAAPPLGPASPSVVTGVAMDWLTWYDAVSGQELGNRDTWIPERSEYAFSIAAPGPGAETVLAAAEADSAELDWLDFDLLASAGVTPQSATVSLGAVTSDPAAEESSIIYVGLPTPVTFRGMPQARWWDMEDASIDFGAITAPAESLTTSVIVEFAMRYGNDHFIIPVPLDIGSMLRVDSLAVTDTFGEVLLIPSIADFDSAAGPFRLFEHATQAADGAPPTRDPLFMLFPTAGQVIHSPALEEVHFARDEAAEIVWAIEHTAIGPDGLPLDRAAAALAHFQPLPPTANPGDGPPSRSYLLRTDVEANWFPFLLTGATPATQLALADVRPLDQSQPTPLPWGRILAPFALTAQAGGTGQRSALLPLEEVTRTGTQVIRGWRYARWTDGRQLSWVGRQVRPGRGPGSSGLTFDLAL